MKGIEVELRGERGKGKSTELGVVNEERGKCESERCGRTRRGRF